MDKEKKTKILIAVCFPILLGGIVCWHWFQMQRRIPTPMLIALAVLLIAVEILMAIDDFIQWLRRKSKTRGRS